MPAVLAALVYLTILGFGAAGWLFNLAALIHVNTLDGLAIARVIGLPLVPLGAILGWFF